MTQSLEIAGELTAEELAQVKNFAEFLISRRSRRSQNQQPGDREHKISFEGWAGCLAHVHPDMSDSDFSRLMIDERVGEAEE